MGQDEELEPATGLCVSLTAVAAALAAVSSLSRRHRRAVRAVAALLPLQLLVTLSLEELPAVATGLKQQKPWRWSISQHNAHQERRSAGLAQVR